MPLGVPRSANGSSPRVRGTVCLDSILHGLRRFIPAGAGNSYGSEIFSNRTAVHPRGCGEQYVSPCTATASDGSSPRVRGTAPPRPTKWSKLRFIPAGAGNRRKPTPTPLSGSVHPRGCGEQFHQLSCWRYPTGSSPRVRGTALSNSESDLDLRFIPAGAGNRPSVT